MPERGTIAMVSAVIIRASLPAPLERLRRRSVADANQGVPAHMTLLYPFVEATALDSSIRRQLASIARAHMPIDYRLAGPAAWPDTIYIAVDPAEPFQALQADLAGAFAAYPIYGREAGFAFVPHVTIAEGRFIENPRVIRSPAWDSLPAAGRADAIEVIAEDPDGRWRLQWRMRLGPGAPR